MNGVNTDGGEGMKGCAWRWMNSTERRTECEREI